jgi:hypothetical protein
MNSQPGTFSAFQFEGQKSEVQVFCDDPLQDQLLSRQYIAFATRVNVAPPRCSPKKPRFGPQIPLYESSASPDIGKSMRLGVFRIPNTQYWF